MVHNLRRETSLHWKVWNKWITNFIPDVQTNIMRSIKEMGPLCSSHLIQLSSLLNLFPIGLYFYVPMDINGRPRNFMKEFMEWELQLQIYQGDNESKRVISWNAIIINKIVDLFKCNFTNNILEDSCCNIRRSKHDFHIHYYLLITNDLK